MPLELTLEVLSRSRNAPPTLAASISCWMNPVMRVGLCAAHIKAVVIHDKPKQLPSSSITRRHPSNHLCTPQIAGFSDLNRVATSSRDRSRF